MERVNLADMFTVPKSYQPPADAELPTCTKYPNLNSRDYRLGVITKIYNPELLLKKSHEILTGNVIGNVVLVCNNYCGRLWNGCFFGFESIEDVANIDKISYRTETAHITAVKYIETNLLLLADANGALQLWSTYATVRCENGYCLFKIGQRAEHYSTILAMDVFAMNSTKAVTGGADCCIKIWDMGSADLYSLHTYRYGHSDGVTAVSTSKSMETTFATCSNDQNFSIWDYRQTTHPVLKTYEKHTSKFTSIYWSSATEHNEKLILGDESGTINVIDVRNCTKFLDVIQVYDRPIHKTVIEGDNMAICGLTNKIKVFNLKNEFDIVYDNDESLDFVRDIYWTTSNKFYSVGWDSQIRLHNL